MQILRKTFADRSVALDVDATNLADVFEEAVRRLVAMGAVEVAAAGELLEKLNERESKGSTAIGHSVAVPHAYMPGVDKARVFFVRLRRPINLGAPDGIPTRFLFFLIGPPEATATHLDTLANIARLMADDEFRYDAREASDSTGLVQGFDRFLVRTSPVAKPQATVSDEAPEGLQYTGRPLGGIVQDIARRYRHYWDDVRDGLHPKCLGSILFLFFACTAPTVIFGGIMAENTGGNIGVVEMIIATSIGGVLYALFSGQPLVILGGTGPLLVFITVLYNTCDRLDIEFLPAYAWVGMWTGLFVFLAAIFDGSCLMRFFTRFTDESFSALISLIFISQAIASLVDAFEVLEKDAHHATALFTLLLALGTFVIAFGLSQFRRSSYLRSWMREFFADFGPTIALAAMTYAAFKLPDVYLDELRTPKTFGPTVEGRPWMIDIWAAPLWIKLGAVAPALFGAVLVYLDQNITARIVNSPDHRLQRGPGYHLDLAIVGGLVGVLSIFGLPWLVAATVRSLNHVRSLATKEEVVSANGASRERILHIRENRVTGFAIHALMGGSLLLLSYLAYVPMAVLYGLFLFMGVVSISGNQFFERLGLWLKEPSLYPATHYLRAAPRWVIHKYTMLQLACLAILWVVMVSDAAILFPLFIALMVPVRLMATRWFDPKHLAVLDAAEEPEEEETHWT